MVRVTDNIILSISYSKVILAYFLSVKNHS